MFINSLSAIFNYTTLITIWEFSALVILVFCLIYISLPKPNALWQPQKEKNLYFLLFSCWKGNAALSTAFWPFFILANCAFFYIDYRAFDLSYTISSWRTVHVMLFFPLIWWMLSVWRCTTHCTHQIYASLARTFLLLFVFDFLIRLYISYFHAEIYFDCRLLGIEYGDC